MQSRCACFRYPAGVFYPAPHVDSAVIQLNIRQTPAVAVRQEKLFFQAVHAAFAQRRKTLLNRPVFGLRVGERNKPVYIEQSSAAYRQGYVPSSSRWSNLPPLLMLWTSFGKNDILFL